MHGAYKGPFAIGERRRPKGLFAGLPRPAGRGPRAAGFSLVELLAVMTIMAILLGLAARSIRPPVSRSSVAAAQIVHGLDLARGFAVARNRTVWVHLAPDEREPDNLQLSFHYSRDASLDPASAVGFRRPQRFENLAISPEVPAFIERPDPAGAVRLGAGDWLVFKADSQVFTATGEDPLPPPPDTLAPVIEIGLQVTSDGRVTKSTERDVAVIHLHGATGESLVYEP